MRKNNVILYEERKAFLGDINGYSSLEAFLPMLHYSSEHLFEKNRYKEKTKILKEL